MKWVSSGWNLTSGANRHPLATASSKVDGGASGQVSACPPESTRGTEHDFWFPYTPIDSPRRARHVPKTANAASARIVKLFLEVTSPTTEQGSL